jgi:hypothetical protein
MDTYIWQRINNQNIQGAQKLTLQRIKTPLNKWANEPNRKFSEDVTWSQNGIEIKTSLYSECLPSIIHTTTVGEIVEKKEPLPITVKNKNE